MNNNTRLKKFQKFYIKLKENYKNPSHIKENIKIFINIQKNNSKFEKFIKLLLSFFNILYRPAAGVNFESQLARILESQLARIPSKYGEKIRLLFLILL